MQSFGLANRLTRQYAQQTLCVCETSLKHMPSSPKEQGRTKTVMWALPVRLRARLPPICAVPGQPVNPPVRTDEVDVFVRKVSVLGLQSRHGLS
eukprot:scaffold79606_cov37-Prasinocladus_malaysianus.AAC.1